MKKYVEVEIDLEDILEEFPAKEVLDCVGEDDIVGYLENHVWMRAEDNYKKYHQDSMLDQAKLDLFVAHIKDISLEQVENLVGGKF